MANRSDGDYQRAPCLFKTFAGGSLRVLESTDAPPNAQHLPCAILVVVVTAASNLVMKDSDGVSNTQLLPVGVYGPWRCAPSTLEAATSANVTVTAFWQPMART